MVQSGTLLYRVERSGTESCTEWYIVVQSCTQLYIVVQSCTEWYSVVPSCT